MQGLHHIRSTQPMAGMITHPRSPKPLSEVEAMISFASVCRRADINRLHLQSTDAILAISVFPQIITPMVFTVQSLL